MHEQLHALLVKLSSVLERMRYEYQTHNQGGALFSEFEVHYQEARRVLEELQNVNLTGVLLIEDEPSKSAFVTEDALDQTLEDFWRAVLGKVCDLMEVDPLDRRNNIGAW